MFLASYDYRKSFPVSSNIAATGMYQNLSSSGGIDLVVKTKLLQVATEWLYSVPEHLLDKHLGNEPSTPTTEIEQQPEDPRRSLTPRRVPLQAKLLSN